MAGRFYEPWVGTKYGSSTQPMLILGESHYGDDAARRDATISLTNAYITGEMNHAFWTNTMNVVRGQSGSDLVDRQTFWNQVAFYNFVQTSVGPRARIAPTPAMFADATEAFFAELDKLKPQSILVLSKRLWINLPGPGPRSHAGKPLVLDGETRDTWIYDYEGGSAFATYINHPSSYFSWPRWHKWVVALKEAAVEARP